MTLTTMAKALLLTSTLISPLSALPVAAAPQEAEPGPAAGAALASSPEERAEKLTAAMKARLSLTDAQVAQVAPVNLDAARQVDTAWKGAGESRAGKRKAAQAIRTINEARDAKLAAILTPEQAKLWEAMKAERKAEAKARAAEMRSTPR